jgi:hypothetical protein
VPKGQADKPAPFRRHFVKNVKTELADCFDLRKCARPAGHDLGAENWATIASVHQFNLFHCIVLGHSRG